MIPAYIDQFLAAKATLRQKFTEHPDSYLTIVKAVVGILKELDPERIHEIDDGDYQGTLVYIIAEKGYQPYVYVAAVVSYGSCSACDTLQSIHEYSDEPPTEEQIDDYMTLALHIVESMRYINHYS